MIQISFYACLLIALGGGLGAVGRYLVGLAALRALGAGFPWGTLAVNVLGSLAMGVLVAVFTHKIAIAPEWRLFWLTGVLGGFTTFSSFSLDAFALWERGAPVLAGAYIFASLALSLTALVAGLLLGRAAWS